MRIALICPRYHPNIFGGGEISLKLLAEALTNRVQLEVFSFDKSSTLSSQTINGVKITRFSHLGRIRELKNSYAFLKLKPLVQQFDVLHSFNMHYHPVVGALGRRFRLKTIATLNDYTFFPPEVAGYPPKIWFKKPYFLFSNRLLLPFIDFINHFVCISPTLRAIYIKNGFNPRKLTIIPQMLDFRFNNKRTITDTFRVLYVGRLEPEKGVECLLRAIARTTADLWIVGHGSQENYLKQLVQVSNLSNEIIFWEHVPYSELPSFFSQCDLFIHPSYGYEPMGRTILEAIQSDLIVISSNRGGLTKILPPGLIFPVGNDKILAEKINAIKTNPNEFKQLFKPLKTFISKIFAPETVTSQYMKLYAGCLND